MSQRTPHQRTIAFAVLSAALLIVLHFSNALGPFERMLFWGLKPIGLAFESLAHLGTSETRSTSNRESALENRITSLIVENAALRNSLNVAVEASGQSAFLGERKLNGIIARIFARSPDPTSQYVVLDRGSTDGVRIGAPVMIHDGIVVGRITEVRHGTSTMLLSLDNRSSFAGVAVDNAQAQGNVSGKHGLSLSMDLIPQTETLHVGEIIVTSGLDADVPPGLVLGDINRIDRLPGAVLQSATLRLLYTPEQLDAVTVILPLIR